MCIRRTPVTAFATVSGQGASGRFYLTIKLLPLIMRMPIKDGGDMQNISSPTQGAEYLQSMLFNGSVAGSVLFMLAVGATIPVFLLRSKAYSMTRNSKYL